MPTSHFSKKKVSTFLSYNFTVVSSNDLKFSKEPNWSFPLIKIKCGKILLVVCINMILLTSYENYQ